MTEQPAHTDISQDACAPSPRISFKRRLRKARREEAKLLARIKRALEAGQTHKAKALQRSYLSSFSPRLVHVAQQNRKVRPHRRTPTSELLAVAQTIDVRRPSAEAAVAHARDKPLLGFRVVIQFNLERRARHSLVRAAADPLVRLDHRQYAYVNGGRNAACRRVSDALDGGAAWFVRLDLQSFYSSVKRGDLHEIMPLPNDVLRHAIEPPDDIRAGRIGNAIGPVNLVHHAREGISQGSSLSPLIAERIITEVLAPIQTKVVIVNFGDDFGLLAKTRPELEAIEKTLTRAFRRCPHGRLQLIRKSGVRRVIRGFDFLAYRFKREAGRTHCMPSEGAQTKFFDKVVKLARQIKGRRNNARDKLGAPVRLRMLVRSWRAAFSLWDAGSDLFWPRFWATGATRQHEPDAADAVADVLEWSETDFVPIPPRWRAVAPRSRMRASKVAHWISA